MKNLMSIEEFGNIDANDDELLEACFEEHEAYTKLVSFSKNIVVGKKGSGKTAIFKKIINLKNSNVFSHGYNLRDYPWHLHVKQATEVFNNQEKYVNSWLYLNLIELAKIICNEDNSLFYDSNIKESREIIEKFLIDTYGNSNPELNKIFTPKEKFVLKPLMKATIAGKGLDLQLPIDKIEVKHFPTIINEVNSTIKRHVLNCLNEDNNYYLCFDELDFGFKRDEEYYDMIIGLIRAANELNREAKSLNLKVNICIFLRDDIFSLLRYEDKRKTLQNNVTLLEWDSDDINYTLKELMEKRFSELLKDHDSEIVKWDDVFDCTKTIDGRKDKYVYLLRMTCNRPRDIIDFCNQILLKYKKRVLSEGGNSKFVNDDIVKAKEIYSRNLKSEFQDELFKHIEMFEYYLEIIGKFEKGKFDLSEFNDFIKNSNIDIDSINMFESLYEFSVIGNYKIGGNKGGSENLFKYKNPEYKFRSDLPIIVHPGLCPTLHLREK